MLYIQELDFDRSVCMTAICSGVPISAVPTYVQLLRNESTRTKFQIDISKTKVLIRVYRHTGGHAQIDSDRLADQFYMFYTNYMNKFENIFKSINFMYVYIVYIIYYNKKKIIKERLCSLLRTDTTLKISDYTYIIQLLGYIHKILLCQERNSV